jgi:hypothetical protein
MVYTVGRDVALDALDWTDQRPQGLIVRNEPLHPCPVGLSALNSAACFLSPDKPPTPSHYNTFTNYSQLIYVYLTEA